MLLSLLGGQPLPEASIQATTLAKVGVVKYPSEPSVLDRDTIKVTAYVSLSQPRVYLPHTLPEGQCFLCIRVLLCFWWCFVFPLRLAQYNDFLIRVMPDV